MKKMKVTEWLRRHGKAWIFLAVMLMVVAVTLQSVLLKKSPDPGTGIAYTYYNNFLIFRGAFFHLLQHINLYQPFPLEHYDLYKYSPAFALLFAPFALLPAWAGLFAWNLLNALVLALAVWRLPLLSGKKKLFALGLIAIELVTSLQNSQSNALMAGLMLFTFIYLEKEKTSLATLFLVLSVFIKIYSLVALALFLFYPKKWKAAGYLALWMGIFLILPLLVTTPGALLGQYRHWIELLRQDHTVFGGISVMTWLRSWFGLEIGKNIVALAGGALLLLPLYRVKGYAHPTFRMLFLSSVLIWMVIFNYMAESPTYIIAVTGVAVWSFAKEELKATDLVLLALVFLFTILSPTDLFPKEWQRGFFRPYVIKAVPCILVWMKIQAELITRKF